MRTLAVLAVLVAAALILWFQVLPRLRTPEQIAELRARLDAIGAGLWKRISARLDTWRTVILGFLGMLWMLLPDLVQQLQGAPWGDWLDPFWARLVAAGLYMLMIVTRIRSNGPVGQAPIMPPTAPGTAVLVPEPVKVALVEEAKAEGRLL